MKKMYVLPAVLWVVSISGYSDTQKVDTSFVTCKGKMTQTSINGEFSGTIRILPYQKIDGLQGQMEWSAEVSTPQGTYEVKPVNSKYILVMQALSFTYVGKDGDLELGIGLFKEARVGSKFKGTMGLHLNDETNTEISGSKLSCELAKKFVD